MMFDSRRGARRVGSVLLAALAGYRNRAKDAIPLMVLPPTTHICFIRRPVREPAPGGSSRRCSRLETGPHSAVATSGGSGPP